MNDFKLNDHKITSGLKAPDGYFDAFPERLAAKFEDRPVVSLFAKRIKLFYAAAAILIIALLVPFAINDKTAELDDATLETYLAYHSGITQFDMLTLLEPDDISAIEIDIAVEDEVIEDALTTTSNFEQLLIE